MAERAAVSKVLAMKPVKAFLFRLLYVRVWALTGGSVARAFLAWLPLVSGIVTATLVAFGFPSFALEPFTVLRA